MPRKYTHENYIKNKEKIKAANKRYVAKNRKKINKRMKERWYNDPIYKARQMEASNRYRDDHRVIINEQNRVKYNGKNVPKRYSFFRDFINELLRLGAEKYEVFKELYKADLTERQREVLDLSILGKTQVEIALKLELNQSSIAHAFNGNDTGGGMAKKFAPFLKEYQTDNEDIIKIIEQYKQNFIE